MKKVSKCKGKKNWESLKPTLKRDPTCKGSDTNNRKRRKRSSTAMTILSVSSNQSVRKMQILCSRNLSFHMFLKMTKCSLSIDYTSFKTAATIIRSEATSISLDCPCTVTKRRWKKNCSEILTFRSIGCFTDSIVNKIE